MRRNPGLPPPDAIVPQRFVEGIGYLECNSARATTYAVFIKDRCLGRYTCIEQARRVFARSERLAHGPHGPKVLL